MPVGQFLFRAALVQKSDNLCDAQLAGQFCDAKKQFARLCSLLGVAIELPEFPLSFGAAIRRMGGFILVVLAHSEQRLFCGAGFHSPGLQIETVARA
jgi:hypothetical protein